MSGDLSAAPHCSRWQTRRIRFSLTLRSTKGHRISRQIEDAEAVTLLREIVETKKTLDGSSSRAENCGSSVFIQNRSALQRSDFIRQRHRAAELAIAPLDTAPACPWVRQRRYERMVLSRTVAATIGSSWGKSRILIRELSLGGGMGTKEDNLRIGSEADLEISLGMRSKIRAHVLLRRARVNEVGFEIVSTIWKAATDYAACWWMR